MGFATAKCPECKAQIKVDISHRAEICPDCRQPFVVSDALNLYDPEFAGEGSVIRFGQLDWIVLKTFESGHSFLVSAQAVCKMSFNKTFEAVTWESSSLRKWLNTDFFRDYFSKEERARIMIAKHLPSDESASYRYKRYDYSVDRVFLLSIHEAKKLFESDKERRCTCHGEPCFWWLRTPILYDDFAAVVGYDGSLNDDSGFIVNGKTGGVRPAIVIDKSD